MCVLAWVISFLFLWRKSFLPASQSLTMWNLCWKSKPKINSLVRFLLTINLWSTMSFPKTTFNFTSSIGPFYCHRQKKVWCQCRSKFCLCNAVCLNIFCWSLIWMLQCPKVLRIFLLCTMVWKPAALLLFIWICVIMLEPS